MILDEKYKIVKLLGQGGFGKVFLGEELLSKRKVAIKKLTNTIAKSQVGIIHEIQQISKFHNDNIVSYFHHFYEDGALHLVMEYCEGGSLKDRIRLKNYTETEVFAWLQVLAKTLRIIHNKGVYHKDIKPDNILFSKNGTIKISDFGIANLKIGTKSYMSPEALQDDHSSPKTIDIYALGVTMMELLIGNNPFGKLSTKDIFEFHKQKKYPILHLPNWQQDIILKAINPNSNDRFQYMVEIEEAIAAQSIPIEFNDNFFKISTLLQLAEKELIQKKWFKALSYLETSKNIDPNNLLLLQAFARYYILTGDNFQAKSYIVRALQLNPRIPFQKELGWINLEESNYGTVISLLSDHLRRSNKDLESFNLLVRAYFETERFHEAIKLSKLLFEQNPTIPCFYNNYLIAFYIVNNELPAKHPTANILENHPIVDYNMSLINDKVKSYKNIKTKFLFLNFNHNTIQKNRISIFNSSGEDNFNFTSDKPIIKMGRIGFKCNDIEFNKKENTSRRHCIIINSKNDVWIYDLKGVNGVLLNDDKIIKKAFLIGVNKIKISNIELWVKSDGDKLL